MATGRRCPRCREVVLRGFYEQQLDYCAEGELTLAFNLAI
jgi:hypothetical protein